MQQLQQWNTDYGIDGVLAFINGPGGMPTIEVNNPHAQASIAMQGAHLLHFQTHGQAPLIWMSPDASFASGKSLRGGIPVCWPWFGPHSKNTSLPAHGPARTSNWLPVATAVQADGSTRISLELIQKPSIQQQCGHDLAVQLHIHIGTDLQLEVESTNKGTSSYMLGQALHTYFQVGDVRQVCIHGLDGRTYIDKVDGSMRKQQQGDILISSETDRIYLATDSHCEIIDPSMQRKINIDSQGSASTVVWNPWIDTARNMGDLGPDGYLHMLCVETTNAADDRIELAAGSTHRLSARYSTQAI